jgi:ribosomal protein L10
MSNLEELNYAIISELRDQLEAKEQMIKMLKEKLEIAKRALKDTERKLLTIDVSNLSSWDRDKLYEIMFHDGVIDKALDKIKGE